MLPKKDKPKVKTPEELEKIEKINEENRSKKLKEILNKKNKELSLGKKVIGKEERKEEIRKALKKLKRFREELYRRKEINVSPV